MTTQRNADSAYRLSTREGHRSAELSAMRVERASVHAPAPRCVWSAQAESDAPPRRRQSFAAGASSEASTASPTRKPSGMRHRPSVEFVLKTAAPQEASRTPNRAPKEVAARRAISVDGDSIKSFQTAHILRAHYMDVRQLYNFQEEIGRGAFGVVKKCTDKLTGQEHACKSILKSSLRCQLDIDGLVSEVNTLQAMQSHLSVVRLRGVFEDSKYVHLVMEFCEGGDLFSRIKQKQHYSEKEAAMVVKSLASVLALAHEKGIMHRDLKPENILMVSTDSDTEIQVADFGSAATFRPGQKLNQLIGSPLYIAPSVLNHSYGPEADMWSLGVVLYILLCGVPPFWGRNNAEIFRSIQHAELKLGKGRISGVSDEVKDLITLLLNRNVDEAISANDVLEHPWIVANCSSPIKKVQTSLTRRSSVTFSAQVKAAISAASTSDSSGTYSLNSGKSLKNSRRHSMGIFRKEEIALPTVDESSSEEEEISPLKSVLYRVPTPFHASSSGSDGDEDSTLSDDEEDDFDEEDADVVIRKPEAIRIQRKSLMTAFRLSTHNHGDLIKRTDTASSDESTIPVAEAIEIPEAREGFNWLKKVQFLPVVRKGMKVDRRQESRQFVGC